MKIKLDENLPASLVAILAARGHDVDTVPDEGLGAAQIPRYGGRRQPTAAF